MYRKQKNLPQYIKIRDVLRERIKSGIYFPGTAIPSETELTSEFGVARITVRTAIEGLIREELLLPMQGKGVFVVGTAVDQTLDVLQGFTRTMIQLEKHPKKHIIKRNVREAGAYYAGLFDIQEKDLIYYLKRVSKADLQPLAVEQI